jgi:hypothetical protein
VGRSSLLLPAEVWFAEDPFGRGITPAGSGANARSSAPLEHECGHLACDNSPFSDPIGVAAPALAKQGGIHLGQHRAEVTRFVDSIFPCPDDARALVLQTFIDRSADELERRR